MKKVSRIGIAALAMGVLAAAAFGTVTITVPGAVAGCRCPALWAPVKCDNGKTYPNQCYADCHHAKGCVPSGDL